MRAWTLARTRENMPPEGSICLPRGYIFLIRRYFRLLIQLLKSPYRRFHIFLPVLQLSLRLPVPADLCLRCHTVPGFLFESDCILFGIQCLIEDLEALSSLEFS